QSAEERRIRRFFVAFEQAQHWLPEKRRQEANCLPDACKPPSYGNFGAASSVKLPHICDSSFKTFGSGPVRSPRRRDSPPSPSSSLRWASAPTAPCSRWSTPC